jgi:hypothetical protein
MQYNYVVTAHKPSNVNLSVTGRQPALIATPILPSCPSSVLAALPSLSGLFAPSSPSSLVLPPPSTSEDALFSVPARPFRPLFASSAAVEHPCTTHTPLPLHPFQSSFHHLLDLVFTLAPPPSPLHAPPQTCISTFHPCCCCMVSPAACTARMAPLHRERPSFDCDSALAAHPWHTLEFASPASPSPLTESQSPIDQQNPSSRGGD